MTVKVILLLLCSLIVEAFGWWESQNCNFDKLVVFGAGYEDDGVSEPDDLVGLHQYSTGKVWPRFLADKMNVKLQNDAVAGGTTGKENIFFEAFGGNKWQVDNYLNQSLNQRVPKGVVFGVATGAVNELFRQVYTEPVLTGMVRNITDGLKSLIKAGATAMFVLNVADYTMAPAFQPGSNLENTSSVRLEATRVGINRHNQILNNSLKELARQNPSVKIIQIDFNKYWAEGIKSKLYQKTYAFDCGGEVPPRDIGLLVPADIYRAGTAKPNDILNYAFYDAYHPASGVHLHIATNIAARLRENGIFPNPKK